MPHDYRRLGPGKPYNLNPTPYTPQPTAHTPHTPHPGQERGAFYAATSFRELRELRLCGCAQLTDEEVLQATYGCSSLRALELPSGKMADLLPG